MSAFVNRGRGPGRGNPAKTLGFVLLLAAAGCSDLPQDVLMLPRNDVESHGFADKKLSESRYLVTYSGPEVTTDNTIESAVAFAAQAARQTAYDLALRHAAEIALAHGDPAFRVLHADNQLKQVIVGHDYRDNGNPVYDNVKGEALGYQTAIYFRPQTTLIVDLLREPAKGAFDARAVAERIKRKYAGATERPIAAGTRYYFGPSVIVHNADAGVPPRRPAGTEAAPHLEHAPYAGAAY